MKKTTVLIASLIVALIAFYAWHTPLRGPLSDAEIETFLSNQTDTGGTAWSDDAAFEAFLRNDDGRPFVMINLMEYRDTAEYPEDYASGEDLTGQQAGSLYGQSVIFELLSRGSYPVARAERYNTIINSVGQSAGEFQSFAMVRYRSRRDLIDMLGSDAFHDAEVHKWASLENTLVAPSRYAVSFKLIEFVPLFLITALCVAFGMRLRERRGS